MRKIILNLLLLPLLFLSACSKKQDLSEVTPSSNKLSDIKLLQRLPQETFAFAIAKTGHNEFKKYAELLEADAKLTQMVATISQASPQLEASAKVLSETIKKIIPTSINSPSKTDLVILFVSGNSKDNLTAGMLAHTSDENFYKNEFPNITASLQRIGNGRISASAADKISIKDSSQKEIAFIQNSGNLLLAATSQSTLDKLLNTDEQNIYKPTGKNFEKFKSRLDTGKNEVFSFSYADLNRIYTIFPVTAAIPDNFKPLLSLLPEELGWNATITADKMGANFSALITEANISEIFKDSLVNPSSGGFFDTVSKNSAFALSLNTKLIKSLATFFLSISAKQDLLQELPAKLNSESEAGFVLNANPKAGLADVALFLPFSDPAWAISNIKSQLGALTQGQGIGTNWNVKQIGGKDVDYLMSPYGIGLYLLNNDKYLIAGISENSILSAISNNQEKIAQASSLDIDLQSPAAVFKIYINYSELYNLLLGIKNFTSVFMGDQANPYFEGLENLKKFNLTGFNSNYQDNLLNFEAAYTFNKQKS